MRAHQEQLVAQRLAGRAQRFDDGQANERVVAVGALLACAPRRLGPQRIAFGRSRDRVQQNDGMALRHSFGRSARRRGALGVDKVFAPAAATSRLPLERRKLGAEQQGCRREHRSRPTELASSEMIVR
jgi:hypothetical protein